MPDSIVSLNEESLKSDLRDLVRRTVDKMPDGLLNEETDDLVGAEHYERTAGREAYRTGYHERKLATPVEETMIETCLVSVSTRRIEDMSEILQGSSLSVATVSNLNEKAFEAVEA